MSRSLDIISVTETWFTPYIFDNEILPSGYTIYRQDRGSRGGGVMVAVSDSIPSAQVLVHTQCELVIVNLQSTHPNTYICCVYLPPSSSTSHYASLFKCIDSLPSPSHIILLGDFNISDVNWSTLHAQSPSSSLFCDFVFYHNLTQLVDVPTHSCGNTLDLILSNYPTLISNIRVNPTISDHHLVSFSLMHSRYSPAQSPHVPLHKWNYSKADFDGLISHLLDNSDLDNCLQLDGVNIIWSHIKTNLLSARKLYVPTVQVPIHPSPRWFTPEIRHMIKKSRTIQRQLNHRKSNHLICKLSHIESSLQDLISSSKSTYIKNLVSSHHSTPGKLFSHLKSLATSTSSNYPILHESRPISDPYKKAELFNSYFNSVFTISDFILPPPDQRPTPSNQLSHIVIDPSDVFKALASLNCTKAPGIDDISPLILKHCATNLSLPLAHLFNTCIQTSSLPDEWKVHKIVPIPKCSDISDIKNYRPISLLCIVSKVLEQIIYDKIIDFIHPLLSQHQFGFLKNRSCLTQLLLSFSYIVSSLESKSPCDIIYLDFRKAFDTIPHSELLFKLWSLGITGPLWSWFQAYLSNRSHLVSVHGCSSKSLPVRSGVPQGSVLGPLLFLIYINDIPNVINFCNPYLFADDAKLIEAVCRHSVSSDHLQQDIASVESWCSVWKLSLNNAKCVSLRISLLSSGSTPPDPVYYINGQPIVSVDKHKDLGVIIQKNLSWSDHISAACAKAYKSLYLIRRTLSDSPSSPSLKLHLYKSLVRSKLSYCSQLWRPQLLKDIICLERVQRRATKFILNDFSSDYKSRLISLNLLPLMYWYELQDLMFLVKCLQDPSDNFDILSYGHISFVSSCTRASSSAKLKHNFCRTTTTRHFYFNRIVHLWNVIPDIDTSQPYCTIKRQISSFLWDHFQSHFDPSSPCSFHLLCPCSSCSHFPLF